MQRMHGATDLSGMLAIHPAQVDVINRAFVPTADELERARELSRCLIKTPVPARWVWTER